MSETSKTLVEKVIDLHYGSDLFQVLKCKKQDYGFVNYCTVGNIERVREAIIKKTVTDINCPHVYGSTGLHEACENGHIEIVKLLLAQPRINVNSMDDDKMCPLHKACENGHIEIVKLLLAQPCINVNSMDDDKMYPLHKACANDHPEIARLLLSKGAEWRKVSNDVKTPYELIPNNRSIKLPTLTSLVPWTKHKPKEFDGIFDKDGNSLVKVDDGLNFNDTPCLTFNNSQEGTAYPVVSPLPPSGGERMRPKRKTHKKMKSGKTHKKKIQRRIKSKSQRRRR